MKKKKLPKVKALVLDIETSPIIAHVWSLFNNDVGLNQVVSDWHLLSFAAKWLDSDEVVYMDQRDEKDISNDKKLLKAVWKLLDSADIVIGQNSKAFDIKKLNARFIIHGMQPPSSYRQIDTKLLAQKNFAFTSNKLEYLSNKLLKTKKSKHKKFHGHELWVECLKGNLAAWKEMETYNKLDVLATEELFYKLEPWGREINYGVYNESADMECACGSPDFIKNGFFYTNAGKYQKYRCRTCGVESRGTENLVPKDVRKGLKRNIVK
jgi:DNA polymerase elongation subunit (family B)